MGIEDVLSKLLDNTIFARVDHAAGAASMGGTALMQDQQSAGIDLPLKALVWEDAGGKAWLTYSDPAWIAQRHGLGTASAATVKAMAALLSAIAQEATQ